jgi:thymidylate synthase
MTMVNSVNDIRKEFLGKLMFADFVIDKTGCKMLEIMGASFIADEPVIFGTLNTNYAEREVEWYESQSLNVNDIPGETPAIWTSIATPDGYINSNYGYLIFSEENGKQYRNVLNELKQNPFSRRATMIYTRPSIWSDYNKDGMSDFICTNAVGYLIRDNKLHAHVMMRSNDVVFGYKNDYYWQEYVLKKLAKDLDVEVGTIMWNCTSLHVYERHFNLIR